MAAEEARESAEEPLVQVEEGLPERQPSRLGLLTLGRAVRRPAPVAALLFAAVLAAAGALCLLSVGPRPLQREAAAEEDRLELKAEAKVDPIALVLGETPSGSPPANWCNNGVPPKLWEPDHSGPDLEVKVLSYNLFWWNLYEDRGSNGNSAGWNVKHSMESVPYDIMGFQECKNPWTVLRPVGLLNEYAPIQGQYQTCMAYRKTTWTKLASGMVDVAEDLPHNFYGRRGAQWMRLKHKKTGKTVFFVNHHGPLSINSGGLCGGQATAHNLLKIMKMHGKEGDAIILVGDFNANAASLTIRTLGKHLLQIYNGKVFGGIDNFFSNINETQVESSTMLGYGGSDHQALSVVVKLGRKEEDQMRNVKEAFYKRPWKALSDNRWDNKHFFCGVMEHNIAYDIGPGSVKQLWKVPKPDKCCKLCQEAGPTCKSWAFFEGGQCFHKGGKLLKRRWNTGSVSGLPYR